MDTFIMEHLFEITLLFLNGLFGTLAAYQAYQRRKSDQRHEKEIIRIETERDEKLGRIKLERDEQLGEMRRELELIKASSQRDQTMGELVKDAIGTLGTELRELTASNREVVTASRESDAELRHAITANTKAIVDLNEVFEVNVEQRRSVERQLNELDITITQTFDNIQTLVEGIRDDNNEERESHTLNAIKRQSDLIDTLEKNFGDLQKAVRDKGDEIIALLTPPPKEPDNMITPDLKPDKKINDDVNETDTEEKQSA